MYWRVRKISPEQVAKTYGVHAVCIVSVLLNMLLLAKVAPNNKLSKEQRTDYDTFARRVAGHIVDGCFLTYANSMYQLEFAGEPNAPASKCELGPSVVQQLQAEGVIPRNVDEMKAMEKQLKMTFSITQINIESVKIDEPQNSLVPIEVSGKVVKNSSEGPIQPSPIRFKFLIGQRVGTNLPIVAKFQDLSGQPAPAQAQQ